MCPEEKYIVDVTPPNQGRVWSSGWGFLFKLTHKKIGLRGGHFCPHRSSIYLSIVLSIKGESVIVKINRIRTQSLVVLNVGFVRLSRKSLQA